MPWLLMGPDQCFQAHTPPGGGALSPFQVQPRRVRGNGTSELAFAPDLERLRKAILDTYKDSYDYTEYHTKVAAYDGYEYIARRKNTLGDSPDSLNYAAGYLPMWDLGNPEDELTMGPNDLLVVYGPRHDVTGKATYTNVNVYASEKVMFSMASVYSDTFGGSVDEYIGAGDPAAGLMYVTKFAYPGHRGQRIRRLQHGRQRLRMGRGLV